MEYERKVHIPQQLEFFLGSYSQGDIGGMLRAMDNIKKLLDDKGFDMTLKDFEKTKTDEIKKLVDKARDALKTISESKKDEELFVDIEEIKHDFEEGINRIESEYWDAVRNKILSSCDKL